MVDAEKPRSHYYSSKKKEKKRHSLLCLVLDHLMTTLLNAVRVLMAMTLSSDDGRVISGDDGIPWRRDVIGGLEQLCGMQNRHFSVSNLIGTTTTTTTI